PAKIEVEKAAAIVAEDLNRRGQEIVREVKRLSAFQSIDRRDNRTIGTALPPAHVMKGFDTALHYSMNLNPAAERLPGIPGRPLDPMSGDLGGNPAEDAAAARRRLGPNPSANEFAQTAFRYAKREVLARRG